MSVVVVMREKEGFVVGCDSRMSSELSFTDSYYGRPKALKLKNGLIVACVGNVGLLDIFAEEFEKCEELNREYILFKVFLPVMKKLQNTCFIDKNNELNGDIAVAYKNKAFIINSSGTIEEVFNFTAIGTGQLPALSSLQTSYLSDTKGEYKVAKAIFSAGELVPSVSKEAWVADTINSNFHLIKYEN